MIKLGIHSEVPDVGPTTVFSIGNYPVANSSLMAFLVVLIVVIIALFLRKASKGVPGKFQNFIEMAYEGVFAIIYSVSGSKALTEKVFPLVSALFIFIFFSNYSSLIPGLNEITYGGAPLFRPATSDFNTTFALALSMILLIQFYSLKSDGIIKYIGKYIKVKELYHGFRKGISHGLFAVVDFCIGILDIVGEIAKVISLSLRLFGNMYAGIVLSAVIMSGVAFAIPAVWMAMGFLSALVQTLVFSLLITAYYSLSVGNVEEPDKQVEELKVIIK